jgi:hypothetical protein
VYILAVIEHGSSDPGPADDKFSRPVPCRGMSRAPGGRDLPTPDPGRRTAQKSFIVLCSHSAARNWFVSNVREVAVSWGSSVGTPRHSTNTVTQFECVSVVATLTADW